MKPNIDDAVEIKKPSNDSQFRLKNCRKCGCDNVAYVKFLKGKSELWRVSCFDCGHTVGGADVRHDVQMQWNGICPSVNYLSVG